MQPELTSWIENHLHLLRAIGILLLVIGARKRDGVDSSRLDDGGIVDTGLCTKHQQVHPFVAQISLVSFNAASVDCEDLVEERRCGEKVFVVGRVLLAPEHRRNAPRPTPGYEINNRL